MNTNNTNLAYKYDDIYSNLASLDNPQLLQSFMISNNADIEKAINIFETRYKDKTGKEREFADSMIKRCENLIVKRIAITEDLFNSQLDKISKSEEEDHQDRTIKTPKKAKEAKTIEHPATKKAKKGEKSKAKVNKSTIKLNDPANLVDVPKSEEKYLSKLQKFALNKDNKLDLNLIKLRWDTYKDKIYAAIDNKDTKSALQYIKLACMCYGLQEEHQFNDMELKKVLNWMKSGHFEWKTINDLIENIKPSVADVVRELDHQRTINGISEEDGKAIAKQYMWNNLREDNLLVKSQEEFEEKWNTIFKHIFDKEHKVENKPKEFNRQNTLDEIYEQHKNDEKGVLVSMTKQFHNALKNVKLESTYKARLAEIQQYLKKKDPELLAKLLKEREERLNTEKEEKNNKSDSTEKQKESKKEETKKEEKKETEKSEKEESEPIDIKTEQGPVKVNIDKYKKQASGFKNLDLIQEFAISLVNKKPNEFKNIVSIETFKTTIYAIVRDRLLEETIESKDGSLSTKDWTEQDVENWIENNVMSYTTGLCEILSATNEAEFKESYKHYINKFEAGKETERLENLKATLNNGMPRTKYVSTLGKKLRKGSALITINKITKELYDEAAGNKA